MDQYIFWIVKYVVIFSYIQKKKEEKKSLFGRVKTSKWHPFGGMAHIVGFSAYMV